jgi:hypothetical protein
MLVPKRKRKRPEEKAKPIQNDKQAKSKLVQLRHATILTRYEIRKVALEL